MTSLRLRGILLLALAGAPACKRAHHRGDLQLVRPTPKVGERWSIDDHLDSRMQITGGPGQVVQLLTTRVRQSHLEILAVGADGIVTGVAVHYDQHHDLQTRDGVPTTKTSPVEGRSYRVTADGGALTAVHDDGTAVSADEQTAVVADVGRSVGKVPAIAALMLARAWHAGDPVTLSDAELHDAFGQNPMMQPVSGTALLVGVAAGVATFEFDLTLARDDADSRAESPTRITVKLDVARFRPVEMTLIGTLHGKVAGMDSTGTLDGRVTYTYE